jgi:hypothetical protein
MRRLSFNEIKSSESNMSVVAASSSSQLIHYGVGEMLKEEVRKAHTL